MAEKKWELAVQLRGRSFARNLETYKMLTRLKPPARPLGTVSQINFAFRFLHVPFLNSTLICFSAMLYIGRCAHRRSCLRNERGRSIFCA